VNRVLVGKPEGKRPLGRPRHRWEDIKMDGREIQWGGMVEEHEAQCPVALKNHDAQHFVAPIP
jgi:hypothetical protein